MIDQANPQTVKVRRAPKWSANSYAPGRGGDHAAALLQGYSGVLQTDGYTPTAASPMRSALTHR